MEKSFKFHLPLEVLEKAKDAQGNEVMKIGGIASTSAKDADGEFLDPNGFDLSYFKHQGFFNWHHMSKKDPTAIIGEPTDAKITPEGLYVEGFLYSNSPIAKSVYDTAVMLEKSSKNRRLGFSIEGKALQRRSEDENHPDYKYVEKAAITGCAITFMPKNPKTYMDLIKGGIDDDYEEEEIDKEEVEKMLTAGSTTGAETTNKTDQSGAPLKLESVGNQKDVTTANQDFSEGNGGKSTILSKSQLVNFTFDKIPGISLKTAERISNLIIKSFDMKSNELNLRESDVEKALDKFEKAADAISKAKDSDEKTDDDKFSDDMTEEEMTEKAGNFVSTMMKAGESKSSVMSALIKKGCSQSIAKSVCKAKFEADDKEGEDIEKSVAETLSELKKGLSEVTNLINDKNYSVGVILKGIYESVLGMDSRMDAIEKSISTDLEKGVSNDLEKGGTSEDLQKAISIFSEVSSKFEGIENKIAELQKAMDTPNPRKSISSRPVERVFNDGQDLNKGHQGNQISMSNKKAVLEVLDKATFEKGYDPEYADALLKFENGADVSAQVLQRLAKEKNIVLV